ncbi:MAG TPA: NAD(P)H-dependent glycerol-3-phosphate dehydrogenase [Actinomycetota bacterium]|nr:NAD(P)H-dependent glycerol-3-phosphate dehydrogenase [Actinomycetota bacterium]
MATVTILGAGAMGSALATPAVAAGNRVRLWGTWLDGGILAELRAGRPHPRTGVAVDPRVELHDAGELAAALAAADLVALAISSDGVVEVARRAAAAGLAAGTPLPLCTKGFGRRPDGRVELLPPLLASLVPGPVVAVGGPCKANEVAAGRPTAAVFAGSDQAAVERCARVLGTPAYRVERSRDLEGVEAAAATKNIYAIAVGVCHGLTEAGGQPWHDLAAATFARAVAEMRRLAVALGGREETVLGLAGVGDLEVTSLSGRNRVFGTRVGRGEPPADALAAMAAAGQTVEGVPAARLARDVATQRQLGPEDLPLLEAVNRILDGVPGPAALLAGAVLPTG